MIVKRTFATYFLAAGLFSSSAFTSEPFQLEGTLFDKVAAEFSIEPELLYAVALAESATGSGKKASVTPWPFVIRTSSGPQFFHNLEEAQAALSLELEKGNKNIDVGMMQINLSYHPHPSPLSLLKPENNLRFGAQILTVAMNSTDDQTVSIGRYNSWKDKRARNYGQRVLAIYRNLLTLKGDS